MTEGVFIACWQIKSHLLSVFNVFEFFRFSDLTNGSEGKFLSTVPRPPCSTTMLGRGRLLTSTILRPSGGPITRQVLRSLSFSGIGWERSRRVAMALAAAKNMHKSPLALRSMASVQPAKLRVLEGEANLRPRDAKKQAEYLRALVQV